MKSTNTTSRKLVVNRPVHEMGRHSKCRDQLCPHCGHPIRINRKYTIHPVSSRPYHADCYRQSLSK